MIVEISVSPTPRMEIPMKILTNRKIKRLFIRILLSLLLFILISAICALLRPAHAALYAPLLFAGAGLSIFILLYLHFREQDRIMEDAVTQIQNYLSGDKSARIACDEEGTLYRLFHEVNSLVSILNAHAEHEAQTKSFLKNTISDISHQLKTPLAALNIYNGILQEETAGTPEIREFTDLSEQELDRIGSLVQNLLKITRLDAGTVVFEKADENISDMMCRIEKHFAFRAGREGKTLSLSGNDTLTLFCDRTWLMEAVINLVKNAFDHTRKGCTIRIEWRAFASIVQIVVRDDGSGIHPEDLPHIFKRFYRSCHSAGASVVSGSSAGTGADAPSLSQQSPGTEPIKNPVPDAQGIGLGLPLAKAVVEAHNGTIEADSEPGTGTVFTLNFLIPAKL